MIRIGTDICSIQRVSQAYARFGARFLRRVLTQREIEYVLSRPAHVAARLAGRFAAKEAAAKALGTGWRGVDWKEFEILNAPSGQPRLTLSGRAAAAAERQGLTAWEVSVSHEREFATACVLAYGSERDQEHESTGKKL
jgi:holo-[acyl-carrier protein] synthase